MTSVLNSFWLGIKVPLRKAVYWLQYNLLKRKRNAFNILMAEETIDYIVKHECSVCRYGDGEIDMITCLKEGFDESRKSDFQTYDEKLAWRLKQILGNGSDEELNLIVCIPYVWKSHRSLSFTARRFIERSFVNNREMIFASIHPTRLYGDSYFTRFYIDARNKKKKGSYIQHCRQIWQGRDLCIIEGEQSRLGVGNDLFDNAQSIERILCPALDAFAKYDEIMKAACTVNKAKLVLIALGHTATVLAYDLAEVGYQAIDIGHIDIEYEWFLMRAPKKVPVPHKYVNEVPEGRQFSEERNKEYLSQIMYSVK